MRLRAGKTGSGKGAGRMVAHAIATPRAAGASGKIVVRGDSACDNRAVVRACRHGKTRFSLVMTKNAAIRRAIDSIAEGQWTPVRYPNAVQDPDTGAWISDAEVAEVAHTAFASTTDHTTTRPVVRRVKDTRYPEALFPVWRYHPFLTNSELPTTEADIVHRGHAVIGTVFADLIDGPLAHLPSGRPCQLIGWYARTWWTFGGVPDQAIVARPVTWFQIVKRCCISVRYSAAVNRWRQGSEAR